MEKKYRVKLKIFREHVIVKMIQSVTAESESDAIEKVKDIARETFEDYMDSESMSVKEENEID
jgi:hypothetical protein